MISGFLASGSPMKGTPVNHHTVLRWGAVLFAVLYGIAMFLPTLPEGAYSDRQVLSLLGGDDRTAIMVGGYALGVAGLVFLAWTSVLASRLDDGSAHPRLLTAGGIAFGLVLMVTASLFASLAWGSALGELPKVDDALLVRATTQQGFYLLLLPGLACASLAVASASILARRTAVLPRWVTVTGLAVAVLLWFGFAWAPQFLVPIWAVLVGFTVRPQPDRPSRSTTSDVRSHRAAPASGSAASGDASATADRRW
jgi:hypothetical protein